jgi:trehalose 6-phosphate synthase
MNKNTERLVIASNRLPFVFKKSGNNYKIEAGSGGLVTALAPVLKDRGGLWVGWPGTFELSDISTSLKAASKKAGYTMKAVQMTEEEVQKYYRGFSNEVIWPLFHDLQSYCNFDPDYWISYKLINKRFASVLKKTTRPKDFIWVHDYHLMCVAKYLREINLKNKLAFYLHIPFPPLDIFSKLPWRTEILLSLLSYDLIGFQSMRDRRNFVQCLKVFIKGIIIEGGGQVINAISGGRSIKIGNFPISIDYNEFSTLARSKAVANQAWFIHEDIPNSKIILGIDRLDYTKGITYRLWAFQKLLATHPELHRKVTLIQVVVPSRRNIPMYQELKLEIEQLVSEINGQYTRSGWVPIHYIYRSLPRQELLAYYRTGEIALITPLKDGMNLIAKEYCASNIEKSGSIILSEFAGAAAQMRENVILVNPYNIDEVSNAIYAAITMNLETRKNRMIRLQQSIQKYDIYWWLNSFLNAAMAVKIDKFPKLKRDKPRNKSKLKN